jgi:methylenetetrahydrofolate reductase (NADPH)
VAGQAARHSPGFAAGAQPTYSHLHAVLRSGRFAVTAELGPPRSASLAPIRRKAKLLRDWVDAANVTDGQSAVVRLASWAGCLVAMQEGVEPVMQLQCRDRNRIALQSDLLGAAAVGIPNVLLLTGDHPRFGDHPDAKPVFDLDSVQLVWTARTMRDQHRLLSGREVRTPPSWLIGAVENPFAPPERFRAERLGKKIAAGAQFVQTQFVFDVPVFARWMQQVRDLGLDERCWILAGTGPIRSLRALEHMCREVPGMHVPDDVVRRLRGVPEDRVAAEGLTICAEVVEQVRAMPGVAGVHLMAFAWEEAVPEILDRAGIGARRGAGFEVRGASRTTSDLAPRSPNPRAERG